eukprot:Rmarinus@m.26095
MPGSAVAGLRLAAGSKLQRETRRLLTLTPEQQRTVLPPQAQQKKQKKKKAHRLHRASMAATSAMAAMAMGRGARKPRPAWRMPVLLAPTQAAAAVAAILQNKVVQQNPRAETSPNPVALLNQARTASLPPRVHYARPRTVATRTVASLNCLLARHRGERPGRARLRVARAVMSRTRAPASAPRILRAQAATQTRRR